jgi:hypothetical protein
MKKMFTQLRWIALAGLAMAGSIGVSRASTLSTDYTNDFAIGTNTAPFAGSGSVAGWLVWYAGGYSGNNAMTNDVTMDYQNQTNTSGSLEVVAILTGYNQMVFFDGFDNQYGYDDSETANLLLYSNISFYIHVPTNGIGRQSNGTNVDFGNIGVGFTPPGAVGWGYNEFARPVIPLAASNTWVKLSANVNYTLPNVNNAAGFIFDINAYGGDDPPNVMTNWIDHLVLTLNPGPPPPPPTLGPLTKPLPGLNQFSSAAGGQYSRNEIMSANDTGLGFADQNDVTYSFTISSFPANNGQTIGTGIQIVGGSPGQYDQSADYNLANCILTTVQQQDDTNGGGGVFQFRYKTNNAQGNGMIYNTVDYHTNLALNTNMWPVEPIGSITNPGPDGALGTWKIRFQNHTNITIITPSGQTSSNFTIDPASVPLFADPATVILFTQPNTTSLYNQGAVLSDFSITGNDTPFNDNFATESALSANWRPIQTSTTADSNSVILVPSTSAYWLPETLPDVGYVIRTSATLGATESWTTPTMPIRRHDGHDYILVDNSDLPSASTGYFQAVQYQFSQLQVLLAGETAAPGTLTGKTGTPTSQSGANTSGANVPVIVNAVDTTFHVVPGVSDTVHFTSTADSAAIPAIDPNDVALVNGTTSQVWIVNSVGSYTITASDSTTPSITAGTSAAVNTTQ